MMERSITDYETLMEISPCQAKDLLIQYKRMKIPYIWEKMIRCNANVHHLHNAICCSEDWSTYCQKYEYISSIFM
jgi:hypothetical protein